MDIVGALIFVAVILAFVGGIGLVKIPNFFVAVLGLIFLVFLVGLLLNYFGVTIVQNFFNERMYVVIVPTAYLIGGIIGTLFT